MRHGLIALALAVACTGSTGTDTGKDPTDGDADTDADADSDTDTDTDTLVHTVPDPVGDPATVDLAGECPLETKIGSFSVQVLDIYSTVSGAVANGVVPITVLEEVNAEGACKLLRRNNTFCDPPCGAGQTCDFDGTCIPYPENQDLGAVTIGGLEADVAMSPVQPGYQYFVTQLPHPVFQPGNLVELRTWGTTWGQDITLHGVGVEPLDLGTDTSWVLYRDTDHTFTWTPSPSSLRSRVHIRMNIDQHGNTPVALYCEFDDTGSAVVPASLVTALIDFGVTGFPNATVTRRTVDSTEMGGGCVQFETSSPAQPSVLVDGFIPCDSEDDCPPDQDCNLAIQICE